MNTTRPAEAILAHGAWLRRLASALAAHEADANDLMQQTYLAAIESPPPAGRPLRPWLGRVLHGFCQLPSSQSRVSSSPFLAFPHTVALMR
jgi:DNA-directed RNA polymerase specialized sigma24 family protein